MKFVWKRGYQARVAMPLAFLALVSTRGYRGWALTANSMRGLGGDLATQAPDGEFRSQTDGSGRERCRSPSILPGEAIFALMRVYVNRRTGERNGSMQRCRGPYLLNVFSKLDDAKMPHDHWLSWPDGHPKTGQGREFL